MNEYSYNDNGVLTITNEDGWTTGFAYNPETLIPFGSQAEAIAYANTHPLYFSPPMTAEELQGHKETEVSEAVQKMLDDSAVTRGYDSIISECSYASSTGNFGKEAQITVNWRDAVWTYIFQVQGDIVSGARTEPTLNNLLTELPVRT